MVLRPSRRAVIEMAAGGDRGVILFLASTMLLRLLLFVPLVVGEEDVEDKNSMVGVSQLVHSEVGVIIDPMTIVSSVPSPSRTRCSLTLHRYFCTAPALQSNDTIAWNTKLCAQWACKVDNLAMRIENCWAGSVNNPVNIIGKDGCTSEPSMLRSPTYEGISFRRAHSIGFLSVRQSGMTHIHMSCTIRLCHYCDPECRESTPPRNCSDHPKRSFPRLWNESAAVKRACAPPRVEMPIVANKAADTEAPLSLVVILPLAYLARRFI